MFKNLSFDKYQFQNRNEYQDFEMIRKKKMCVCVYKFNGKWLLVKALFVRLNVSLGYM